MKIILIFILIILFGCGYTSYDCDITQDGKLIFLINQNTEKVVIDVSNYTHCKQVVKRRTGSFFSSKYNYIIFYNLDESKEVVNTFCLTDKSLKKVSETFNCEKLSEE